MKKRLSAIVLTGLMGLSLAACGTPTQVSEASTEGTTFETVGLMNPWRNCTEEEAKDLDGFDLQAVAEALSGPMQETEAAAETAGETSEITAPSIDITGCDTFTDIVDKKLSAGMGYANVNLDGTDVLLVSSGTFDDLEGQKEAIDATIFMYKDGAPFEVGQVCSNGTAYPLTVADGKLFAGGNHWIGKFALTGDKLMVMEKAYVVYDESGNGTYYYESDDGGDYSNFDSAEAEKIFDSLLEEMMGSGAEIVSFSQVQ